MITFQTENLLEIYKKAKEKTLYGKWITFNDISPLLYKRDNATLIGRSENRLPIYSLKFGTGKKRILIWSQMHGNESTGTKALFDVLNFLESTNPLVKDILRETTIQFVPMLNPDGALAYTRKNAKGVDLNRDAVALLAIESKLLRDILDDFKPHFCFNLHDQRTIFGVEGTNNPASISFLAPSEEETRALTKGRKETMDVIVAMNRVLQQIIPNHIGRYTDEFYPTATGDNFQKLGYNTILIEAGHYPNDYQREKVREFNFYALIKGLHHIAVTNSFTNFEPYFSIPNNEKSFVDVRIKGTHAHYLYKESVIKGNFTSILSKDTSDIPNPKHTHKDIS